ncbi:nucleotide-diphospho-sugar transferase [Sporodiniella umbellata]|nr:nucleotide-diphospho-sugar transferase [Sporodiniella umbellata]
MTDTKLRDDVWNYTLVKGAFYMMTRNEDLFKAKATVKSIEERFNGRLNVSYPWIFLNNQKFSPEFKKYMKRVVSDPDRVYFGQVDLDSWNYPSWIDSVRSQTLFTNFRDLEYQKMRRPSYSNYLRYQSGLFFHHPLFDDVDYVWRVDAGSHYNCEMFRNDPFVTMQKNNKTIANSVYSWLVDSKDEYNMCQISTSFEIVSLDFLKSEQYRTFFYYLDLVGGFFYERWTDSAVRTIATALFLKKQDLHFFNDVAYTYKDKSHCPLDFSLLENCACDYKDSYDYRRTSCTLDLLHIIQPSLIDDMVSFAKVVTSQYDD